MRPGEVDPEARDVLAEANAWQGHRRSPDTLDRAKADGLLAALAAEGFSVGRWEHVANRHAYQRPDGATYYVLTAPDELPFTEPAWTEPLYRRVKGESE